jgi:hypothetical protein
MVMVVFMGRCFERQFCKSGEDMLRSDLPYYRVEN